jgi:hypothetical protein
VAVLDSRAEQSLAALVVRSVESIQFHRRLQHQQTAAQQVLTLVAEVVAGCLLEHQQEATVALVVLATHELHTGHKEKIQWHILQK